MAKKKAAAEAEQVKQDTAPVAEPATTPPMADEVPALAPEPEAEQDAAPADEAPEPAPEPEADPVAGEAVEIEGIVCNWSVKFNGRVFAADDFIPLAWLTEADAAALEAAGHDRGTMVEVSGEELAAITAQAEKIKARSQ